MNPDLISVAIVTPVHNRRETTLQCLRSLSRIDRTGLDVHVWVVDDASTDGTAEAISLEFPEVKVIAGNGDLWFTEGTNVGVRAALRHDPKYILMMNDDQVFDFRFLRSMVETAERHPHGVVGALLLLWDQPHKVFQTAPVWKTFGGGWRHWSHQTVWTVPDRPWKVDLIVGNCVLIPAAAIRQCGLMDSKHFLNFGDAEYTPRLKRAGWQLLIDPRARVFCQPNVSPSGFRKLSISKKFREIFLKAGGPYSIRRRFYTTVGGAPNKFQGLMAFHIFFIRVLLGKNIEGKWGQHQVEPPLSEVFADAVINE